MIDCQNTASAGRGRRRPRRGLRGWLRRDCDVLAYGLGRRGRVPKQVGLRAVQIPGRRRSPRLLPIPDRRTRPRGRTGGPGRRCRSLRAGAPVESAGTWVAQAPTTPRQPAGPVRPPRPAENAAARVRQTTTEELPGRPARPVATERRHHGATNSTPANLACRRSLSSHQRPVFGGRSDPRRQPAPGLPRSTRRSRADHGSDSIRRVVKPSDCSGRR